MNFPQGITSCNHEVGKTTDHNQTFSHLLTMPRPQPHHDQFYELRPTWLDSLGIHPFSNRGGTRYPRMSCTSASWRRSGWTKSAWALPRPVPRRMLQAGHWGLGHMEFRAENCLFLEFPAWNSIGFSIFDGCYMDFHEKTIFYPTEAAFNPYFSHTKPILWKSKKNIFFWEPQSTG